MYDDWWVKKMDVEEWILKHFKMTRDVMTSEKQHSIYKYEMSSCII